MKSLYNTEKLVPKNNQEMKLKLNAFFQLHSSEIYYYYYFH